MKTHNSKHTGFLSLLAGLLLLLASQVGALEAASPAPLTPESWAPALHQTLIPFEASLGGAAAPDVDVLAPGWQNPLTVEPLHARGRHTIARKRRPGKVE